MKTWFKSFGLFLIAAIIFFPFALSAKTPESQKSERKAPGPNKVTAQVARGRYLVRMCGCNDCHTDRYMASEAKVPESDWLAGDSVGWHGPWGTTYAINLRLFIPNLSEDAWVKVARTIKSRPAMPWWVLHEMAEQDLRAIYQFTKTLGVKGENAPAYLPPGQKPNPPYFEFVPPAAK